MKTSGLLQGHSATSCSTVQHNHAYTLKPREKIRTKQVLKVSDEGHGQCLLMKFEAEINQPFRHWKVNEAHFSAVSHYFLMMDSNFLLGRNPRWWSEILDLHSRFCRD
ncbi:hypothetical protein ILYODFUR_039180 [Ilyodon furcidens]|uniref:Uncharacterized protein n=1 Tax=Ilyodon furcidens TaxID=33524 RepID=A0ABV0UEU0_9TELE